MIFPIPYTKGTKTYPIVGISETFPTTVGDWATCISNNLSNAGGVASKITSPSNSYYSIYRTADIFMVNWRSNFSSALMVGFPYILIPKLSSYPTYLYQGDAENVLDEIGAYGAPSQKVLFDLLQADPGTGEVGLLIWYVESDFEYESKLYTLYSIKYITHSNNPSGTPTASFTFDIALSKEDGYIMSQIQG